MSTQRLLELVWRHNAPWIPALFSAAGTAIAFILGGRWWGIGFLFGILGLAVVALWITLRRVVPSGGQPIDQAAPVGPMEEPSLDRPGTSESSDEEPVEGPPTERSRERADLEEAATADDSPMARGAQALEENDLELAREAFDEWSSLAPEPDQIIGRQAFAMQLLATSGDDVALTELRLLADSNPTIRDPAHHLIQTLSNLGEPVLAFDEARSRSHNLAPPDAARLLIRASQLVRERDPSSALDLARTASDLPDVNGALRAEALREVGYSLQQSSRKYEAFGMFEEALSLNPADSELRADLAYAYLQDGLFDLAITHFLILDKAFHPQPWVLNNFGWALHLHGCPIRGTATYRKAAAGGHLRAMGNLAALQLDSGFVPEAQDWIGRADGEEASDRRLAHVKASIPARQDDEHDRVSAIDARGREARRVVHEFGGENDETLPSGTWELSTGLIVTLVASGHESHSEETEIVGNQPKVKISRVGDALFEIELSRPFNATTKGMLALRGSELFGILRDHPDTGMLSTFDGQRRDAQEGVSPVPES